MATQADRTKKPTKSRVGWFKDDIQVLLDWLSFRDTNGMLRNAILYKKHAAGASKKIVKETEIAEKRPGTTDKVIERKLRSMKDTYLKMRNKAESTDWGVDLAGHDEGMSDPGSETIRYHILHNCPWYYDFKDLFDMGPNVVAPFLSESGQPDRVNSRPPGDEENKDTTDDEEDDEELPWTATPTRQSQNNDALSDLLLPADFEKELKRDLEEIQRPGVVQPTAVDQSIDQLNAPAQNEVSSIPTGIPTPSRSEIPAAKTKTKRKKPAKSTVSVLSSSEEERSVKKAKGSRTRTVADAMIKVERIRDTAKERDAEVQKIHFEAEQKQRNQQHAILLQQGQERLNLQQETLLRLQLQLRKGQNDSIMSLNTFSDVNAAIARWVDIIISEYSIDG